MPWETAGPIPAEVSAAYHAAAGPKRQRPSKGTPVRPATTAAPVTPVDEQPGPPPAEQVVDGQANADGLLERISRLEQQVAELTARLEAADAARPPSSRRSRFGRRS